jgi:tetratricopeptide (TPR) repeat protein
MALQREEDRIRKRLADGYRLLEAQRIDTLVARARALLDQGQPGEALDVIAALATLRPDHPALAALEAQSLVASARALEDHGDFAAAAATYAHALQRAPGDSAAARGERRSRAESDARGARTREIRARFGAAMDAFGAGDLPRARRGFLGVLAASPQDAEASAMLQRVERATAARLEQVLRQARWELDAGRLDEAARRLDEARALDAGAPPVAQMAAAIAQARATAGSTSTPAVAPGMVRPGTGVDGLPPQKRRELDDLYRRGLAALRQGRSDDAIRYWELVRSEAPGYPRLGESLVQEYLRRGLDVFAAGRLEEAVSLWEKALAIDPRDARARGYLERAQKQIGRRKELLGSNL